MDARVVEHHYLARAVEPIHIGGTRIEGAAGRTLRDSSGLPFVPASSLKGCCRANCAWQFGLRDCDGKGRECAQPHRCASCAVFGHLNSYSIGTGSSLVRFSAGTLVSVPFLVGSHQVSLSSPKLLRSARLLTDDEFRTLATLAKTGVVLVGHEVEDSTGAKILAALPGMVTDASPSRMPPLAWKTTSVSKLLARAIIVDDFTALDLLQSSTGTMSSIAIQGRTETARMGALYRTEFIVPDSVLAFSVTYSDPSILGVASFLSDRDGRLRELPATFDTLQTIIERGLNQMSVRGIGGKRNRGFGRLEVATRHFESTLDTIPIPSSRTTVGPTVFISYAHADASFVRRLASALQAEGLVVWLDETSLVVGDRISRRILDGIAESVFVVVVLSEAAIKSRWVESELSAAFDLELQRKTKTVLPIVLDEYAKSNLPLLVRPLLYTDAGKGFAATVHALMRCIRPA